MDHILSLAQKKAAVLEALWHAGAPLSSRVHLSIDSRKGWDYSVQRDGEVIRVTWSVPFAHQKRWHKALPACARAIGEVTVGKRQVIYKGRGPLG